MRTPGISCAARPALLLALLAAACSSDLEDTQPTPEPPPQVVRTQIDYGLAMRTAALKLTGGLPTLAEIKELLDAPEDQRAAVYAKRIDAYLAHPRFPYQQLVFWRNTFKMGGGRLDTAPAFAAMVVVTGRPLTDLLTATKGTCPALENGKFVARECNSGIEPVGVLTDPGMLAHFYGPMAFRRTRWVQEVFLCRKFPAETGGRMEQYPSGVYSSPWEMKSISGKLNSPMARVDFHETNKGELCANCHATLNHVAPLLATFNEMGAFQAPANGSYPVRTPVPGSPPSQRIDWLPAGEPTAWRFGKPVMTLKELGAAIAADPEMVGCYATRIWNWALSRGDVIVDQSTLTPELREQLAGVLAQNNLDARKLIRHVLLSESFVRY
jgi:hypothetical protein